VQGGDFPPPPPPLWEMEGLNTSTFLLSGYGIVALQAKGVTLQQALALIDQASPFYRRQRTEQAFKLFSFD